MNSSTKGLIISAVFGGLFVLLLGFRTYIHLNEFDSFSNYFQGKKNSKNYGIKQQGGDRRKKSNLRKRRH